MADLVWNGVTYAATCPECDSEVLVDLERGPRGNTLETPRGALQCQFCARYVHSGCLPEDIACCHDCSTRYFARERTA